MISTPEKPPQKRSYQNESRKHASDDNTDTSFPDATQCQEAFEAVLANQYMHLIPALLTEYSVDLNIELDFARTIPINYVTELDDVETVRLFLASSTDANLTHSYHLGGRALLTAVKKRNKELTKSLVQSTGRVPCTRVLSHAVSEKDIPIIKILLRTV
jgi:serum/glucocorticoid-regulated kinase 2